MKERVIESIRLIDKAFQHSEVLPRRWEACDNGALIFLVVSISAHNEMMFFNVSVSLDKSVSICPAEEGCSSRMKNEVGADLLMSVNSQEVKDNWK